MHRPPFHVAHESAHGKERRAELGFEKRGNDGVGELGADGLGRFADFHARLFQQHQHGLCGELLPAEGLAHRFRHERGHVRDRLAMIGAHPHRLVDRLARLQIEHLRDVARGADLVQLDHFDRGLETQADQVFEQAGELAAGRLTPLAGDGEGAAAALAQDHAFALQLVQRAAHGDARHAEVS